MYGGSRIGISEQCLIVVLLLGDGQSCVDWTHKVNFYLLIYERL